MESHEVSSSPPPSIQSSITQSFTHGIMSGHNSYAPSALYSNDPASVVAPNSTSMIPATCFPFTSPINPPLDSKPLVSLKSNPFYESPPEAALRPCGFSIESPGKKKRGRPRKYGPNNGRNIALALSPARIPSTGQADSGSIISSDPTVKRQRGRPPGSGKRQLNALGTAGVGFTPHVITIKAGEDVAWKIRSFSQEGPRAVCILSANGAICNVTLRQPAGGTVSYEGRFEIISLSGSFMLPETGGDDDTSRMGGISVSLAGSDGRVLGGGVSGNLVAATHVHVIVGSFIADAKKSFAGSNLLKPAPPPPAAAGANFIQAAAAAATSETYDDDSGDSTQNDGFAGLGGGGAGRALHGLPMYTPWPSSTAKILQNQLS